MDNIESLFLNKWSILKLLTTTKMTKCLPTKDSVAEASGLTEKWIKEDSKTEASRGM